MNLAVLDTAIFAKMAAIGGKLRGFDGTNQLR
jgi:hypothetical protein